MSGRLQQFPELRFLFTRVLVIRGRVSCYRHAQDYLDLVEVAEEHETCISWYMGKLPLHTDLPELFEDASGHLKFKGRYCLLK